MLKVNPIPKKLLPNSVDYYKYLADTGEGSGFDTKVVLENVKIEEATQYSYTSNGREVVGKAMLFYDVVNSSGLTDKPIVESEVVFENRTYYIVSVDVLRTEDTPHHYEMLLK
jgi:hypothetical protein